MKRLFQPLALMTLGLALFSCDKSEPMNRTNGGELLGEPTRFEMTSSLGAVGIESLSSNTDKADDELRANLHFRGLNSAAQTTIDDTKFGASGDRKAYWGVIHSGTKQAIEPCDEAVTSDPGNPSVSTVFFNGTGSSTIAGKQVKMYAIPKTPISNISKGIMLLDGTDEGKKHYFMTGKSDPNERIQGVTTTTFDAGRHIPIMTELVPIADMESSSANTPTFAPRGSLIGLNIKNNTGDQMIITDIIVPIGGALNFGGYFDWSQDGKASFHAEYTTEQTTAQELLFPVYNGATLSYTLADNTTIPCFYVWGFQNANKKGEAFEVQIRYKTTTGGATERTRTFKVYAPTTKVQGETGKMFDDGYAYNVVLTVNATNKAGGTAADWNNGGRLSTVLNPLTLVAEYDIAKVADTQGTNHTLAFVPSHNIKTKNAGADAETDYSQFDEGTDVGMYTWAEAMRLFGYDVPNDTAPLQHPSKREVDGFDKHGFKATDAWINLDKNQFNDLKFKSIAGKLYYLPNQKQWNAIIPKGLTLEQSLMLQDLNKSDNKLIQLVTFDEKWQLHRTAELRSVGKIAGHTELLGDVQIGDDILLATEYDDEYITKESSANSGEFVTYAIRFKGTKYESAWRYAQEKGAMVGSLQTYKLVIKNVMLGENSGKTLTDGANCVATEEFFNQNNSVERLFPGYGFIKSSYRNDGTTIYQSKAISNLGRYSFLHSSTFIEYASGVSVNTYLSRTSLNKMRRIHSFCVRPFRKN